jgi:hypothetical protein
MGSLRTLRIGSKKLVQAYPKTVQDLVRRLPRYESSHLYIDSSPYTLFDVSEISWCSVSHYLVPANFITNQPTVSYLTARGENMSEPEATRVWDWFKSTDGVCINLGAQDVEGKLVFARQGQIICTCELYGCVCSTVEFGDMSIVSNNSWTKFTVLFRDLKVIDML